MAQGTVRTYDPLTHTGLVLDDNGDDIQLAEDALDGSIFLMLRQGQRINYTIVGEGDARRVTQVRIGQDGY